MSNKALLYDCDDGHGGREIIYIELTADGGTGRSVSLWRSYDGRCFLSDPPEEISEEAWQEIVDPILAPRADLIPWNDCSPTGAGGSDDAV